MITNNEQIIRDFKTEPLRLIDLATKYNLSKQRIHQILMDNISWQDYKARLAYVKKIKAEQKAKAEVKTETCAYCGTKFTYRYDYSDEGRKYCSYKCFADRKRNLMSPEEREAHKKQWRHEHYLKNKKAGRTA